MSKKENERLTEENETYKNINSKLCEDNGINSEELFQNEHYKNENEKLRIHLQHLNGDNLHNLNINQLNSLSNTLRQSLLKVDKQLQDVCSVTHNTIIPYTPQPIALYAHHTHPHTHTKESSKSGDNDY